MPGIRHDGVGQGSVLVGHIRVDGLVGCFAGLFFEKFGDKDYHGGCSQQKIEEIVHICIILGKVNYLIRLRAMFRA